jgi:hypothetical protein
VLAAPTGVGTRPVVGRRQPAVAPAPLEHRRDHHVEDSEGDDDPRIPVVDELVELLPKKDGKPYLAVFGATHLDKDHTQGFAELLDRVTIGDLWFTPRVLWEQDQNELCDDAKAFRDEAERRINKLKADGGGRLRRPDPRHRVL